MDRRRRCGNCGKAGAGFGEGFSKQLVGIIKKILPKASFIDFHSCGSFHSASRPGFLFFVFCFEEKKKAPGCSLEPKTRVINRLCSGANQ